MKFRINYTIGEYDDSFIVEGETIEEIKAISAVEEEKRGLDPKKNNMWSEQLS